MNNSKIKTTSNKQIIPVTKVDKLNNDKPIFLFSSFCYESIETPEFNNKYANMKTAVNTINAFVEKIKILENSKLFEIKNLNHFHLISGEREVKRIEEVLREYKINELKIKSFEGTYYEIPFGSGQRIICSKVENVFEILFIDSNHMIYKESCRFLKAKEYYEHPSCFEKIDFSKNYFEMEIIDMAKMIIEDYEAGKINSADEIVDNLKYIIGNDEFPQIQEKIEDTIYVG